MRPFPPHIEDTLRKLETQDRLRTLRVPDPSLADFCSNDYLGLARAAGPVTAPEGSTGSRLLTGHHAAHTALEADSADLFRGPSTLLFGSGYLANLGVLSCIAGRNDTFFHDEAVHASMKDGMRLSPARRVSFRHNDLADLDRKLSRAGGNCFIVAEALYSMDGDMPDLEGLCQLTARHGAWLILDEAHSTGLYGQEGAGLCVREGLSEQVFLRIHTFGKAVGRHGAVVVGREEVRRYLINRARAFIYTTAMPPAAAEQVRWALGRVREADEQRRKVFALCEHLAETLSGMPGLALQPTKSPILPLRIEGDRRVVGAAERLRLAGFDLRAIRAPTVPEGGERLRITLHAFNTRAETGRLAEALRAIFIQDQRKT